MRRPWARFDWDLRSCGLHGHVLYRPAEPTLAERLRVDTPVGTAWRCLRCGDFVPATDPDTGPADRAPIVLRGRALRDAFILRLLALERLVRGLLLVALAYGIYRFNGSRDALRQTFDSYLPALKPLADKLGIDLQASGPVRLIERALSSSHATLAWVTLAVLGYGVLELVEALGLALMRRWGEYVAVVGTGVFLPLEVYEMTEHLTLLRALAFLVNLAAVVYLLYSKRLFGLRGGHAAFRREREGQSLLEIESAARPG